MASIFGHCVAAYALTKVFPAKLPPSATWLACLCACLPDADVLGFQFGVPYASQWGHRGFTHSIVFGLVFGTALACLVYKSRQLRLSAAILFSLATISHALLDMLTNGGKGVALWWPMSNERIFFPFRPIAVSPLGAEAFFSDWGVRVLMSEVVWIGIPCLVIVGVWAVLGRKRG